MGKGSDLLRNSLSQIMDRRGWNQTELAKAIGKHPPHISRMLSPEAADPRLDTVVEIAEALGFQPWELLKPEGAASSPPPIKEAYEAIGRALGLPTASQKPQGDGFKRVYPVPTDDEQKALGRPLTEVERLRSDIIRLIPRIDDARALEVILKGINLRLPTDNQGKGSGGAGSS
jgi:transcriptional regulator with XRE-family HTH domain